MAFQFRKIDSKEKQETSTSSDKSFVLADENLETEKIQQKARSIPSILSEGSYLEGSFSFDEPVCVEGVLSGQIKSGSTLLVAEAAQIEALTNVSKLIVYGNVEGDVWASELVEVFPGAQVIGNISSPRLIIHDGAVIRGRVSQLDS